MDNIYKTFAAVGGSATSYLWGGWSALLGTLLTFVFIDYASGLVASGIEGKLSSKKGYIGIAKKVGIFAIVAIAHLIDQAIGEAHFIRDAVIFFYLSNEVLSILENFGRIGIPIPPVIKQAVEILKGKSENHGKSA